MQHIAIHHLDYLMTIMTLPFFISFYPVIIIIVYSIKYLNLGNHYNFLIFIKFYQLPRSVNQLTDFLLLGIQYNIYYKVFLNYPCCL